ncbi:MAG: cell division protein FtsK [Candidatus Cloacimonetes bacterium HGW-Cloacimonetes-1]|jgi:S-DNA-T family DNA segregation ATPase FtsK/SpoIIIE|nr:MAG: cell division protein FtsK [Candidatus Cloacimonetes bacterium HGW-Cloacimonetes-1]
MAKSIKTQKPIRKKKSTSSKSMSLWQKRLIFGAIAIMGLLIFLSLIPGEASITEDIANLNGNYSQFFTAPESFHNPIGRFGVVISYPLIRLFGYIFSVLCSIIILLFSFFYFIDPEKERIRIKGYLFIVVLFIFQALLSSGKVIGGDSILPRALWYALQAVFSSLGAKIILIGAMVLLGLIIVEVDQIKRWFAILWEDIQRWKEDHEDENAKPSISSSKAAIPELKITVDKTADPNPSINDHVTLNKTPVFPPPMPDDKKPQKAELKAKPKRDDDDDDDRVYEMPSISDFLESPVKLSDKERKDIEAQILVTSKILKDKLAEFGIEAEVINVNIGPIITQYELKPAAGVKVSKFPALADDLALAIKAKSIRVQAPIPGRGLIGIEIPNFARDMIYLRDILLSEEMRNTSSKLVFGLGKDISGKPVVTDLAKMPHLLIAGATGSGKSVCINTIIMSLIMRTTPDDLRLVMIDPKKVELAGYNDLPHLIGNVVTDPDGALETMYWAVKEMEKRYELLQEEKVRDINGYNEKAREEKAYDPLPFIVIIIDEFADLIMTSGKDIELPITRLAQMARAVGIHLILATQRPSIKVITGIIKANFPARIAFQVSSRVDSRVILDMIGAERLLGQGDMLFIPPGKALPERIHGTYVSDHEIARTCDFLRMQPKPKNDFTISVPDKNEMGAFDYDDELFPEAARIIVTSNTASVSMLQRHFKIGYARAGRLVDMLERAHIVGPHLGSKSRDVLATMQDLIRMGLSHEEY